MFANEAQEAKQVFDIINADKATVSDDKIDKAIAFLNTNKNIGLLNDIDRCNEIFKSYVSGEYDLLVPDVKEIKNLLYERLDNNVYEWIIRKNTIDDIVRETATEKYNATYYNEVFIKIDNMPPEQAKSYLKDLIKNEPLVGIKILKS